MNIWLANFLKENEEKLLTGTSLNEYKKNYFKWDMVIRSYFKYKEDKKSKFNPELALIIDKILLEYKIKQFLKNK